MRMVLAVLAAAAAPALAVPAGPTLPIVSKASPVQQSIALYRDKYRHGYVACPAPTHANEVVICGNGRGGSADRLPLPDERGPRDGPRTATGDIPSGVEGLENPDICGPQSCANGQVNLIAAAQKALRLVGALADHD